MAPRHLLRSIALVALAAGSPLRTALADPPAHVRAAREQVDWTQAGSEAVGVLAGYLATDTVNPPGNELAGVVYLGGVLEQAGIPWRAIPHEPGRASLIARVAGSGKAPPLCLLSHIDVVLAETEYWEHDPLGGEIIDGVLHGRGALDMKGMGAIEAMTLVWLKRLEIPLDRDVILLAVADEEDGNRGMEAVTRDHWEEIGCSHIMNEGGMGIRDAFFEGQDLHGISVAEKGYLWVRMVAEGTPGHGSVVSDGEAPMRLQQAMAAIARRKARPVVTREARALLKTVGRHKGGIYGAALKSGLLRATLVKPKLMKIPATRALLTDTVHLTGMSGGSSPNVVPSRTEAVYDCRLLPGTQPESVLEELRHLTRKVEGISFQVIDSDPSGGSEWIDDPLFEAIVRYAEQGRPQAVAAPFLSVGFTDSIYARRLGVRAYGYVPFLVTQEQAESMHGHNEQVDVDQVGEGLRRLFSMVVDFAGTR